MAEKEDISGEEKGDVVALISHHHSLLDWTLIITYGHDKILRFIVMKLSAMKQRKSLTYITMSSMLMVTCSFLGWVSIICPLPYVIFLESAARKQGGKKALEPKETRTNDWPPGTGRF